MARVSLLRKCAVTKRGSIRCATACFDKGGSLHGASGVRGNCHAPYAFRHFGFDIAEGCVNADRTLQMQLSGATMRTRRIRGVSKTCNCKHNL